MDTMEGRLLRRWNAVGYLAKGSISDSPLFFTLPEGDKMSSGWGVDIDGETFGVLGEKWV